MSARLYLELRNQLTLNIPKFWSFVDVRQIKTENYTCKRLQNGVKKLECTLSTVTIKEMQRPDDVLGYEVSFQTPRRSLNLHHSEIGAYTYFLISHLLQQGIRSPNKRQIMTSSSNIKALQIDHKRRGEQIRIFCWIITIIRWEALLGEDFDFPAVIETKKSLYFYR